MASVLRLGYEESDTVQKQSPIDGVDMGSTRWGRQNDGISKSFIVYDAAPENKTDKEQRAGRMGIVSTILARYFADDWRTFVRVTCSILCSYESYIKYSFIDAG